MKKRLALIMASCLALASLVGCDDGSGKTAAEANEAVSADIAASEEAGSTSSEEIADDNADSSDAQSEEAEQTNAESDSADSAVTSDSSTETSYNPEDVVEPEIADEIIENPVVEEEVAPEDDTINIVFMGDSQFDNARDTGSEIPAYTGSLIDKKAKVYNLAIGGTPASLERSASDSLEGWTDTCFVGMAYALAGRVDRSFLSGYEAGTIMDTIDPATVDFYVIEYGANDYINGKELYNPDNPSDVHTYRGALDMGINALKSVSPDAKIILCSPSYCMWYNADGFAIGDSYTVSKGIGTLSEYADICGNVCEEGGYTYIDTMYATYFDLKTTTVDSYLSDGLHYKEVGRQIYATTIAHFINKSLGTDPEPMSFIEIDNFSFGS